MTFVLIFIIATAAIIVLVLAKIRTLKRSPHRARELHTGTEWFTMHPEALDRTLRMTTNTVIKPALYKTLVALFALYKNASVAVTKFLRKKFYALLHYSLRRDERKMPSNGKSLREMHEHHSNGNGG